MGIKDVNQVIGTCSRKLMLNQFRGKKIGVDARNFQYRFLRSKAYQSHQHPILRGFMNQINMFRKYSITPIYVFDGASPEEKAQTIVKRQIQSNRVKARIEILKGHISTIETREYSTSTPFPIVEVDMEVSEMQMQLESLQIQTLVPRKADSKLCQELFDLCGIMHIEAPAEADEILASLALKGNIDVVLSADMDLLTYGVPTLMTKIQSIGNGQHEVVAYDLSTVLAHTKWTFEQFRDFCILCGCDYIDRIKFLGVKTAKNLITTHFTIENILAAIERDSLTSGKGKMRKYVVPKDYKDSMEKVRAIFAKPSIDTDVADVEDADVAEKKEKEKEIDIEMLDEFIETYELTPLWFPRDVTAEARVSRQKKALDEKQTSITSFFI